ncbi:cytochrome c oxidase assembly protein [Chelativorans intermedius]|uniref:Cytochrome c oxidase assembly protein CtaG n=1 Tax=Chelativorans intermedius TaxID=515947 RepID=A0ABV6DBD0_9HYPH|nr:cytochrome c oxidase assembly protein [Chelativorans intermedius]MCT9000275.1 cytochrome c oxidase assembly protein [Chelativorans intermedius]
MHEQSQKSARSWVALGGKRWTAISLGLLVLAMVGLSFAAVPLYRWFCQVTGYGGTTQVAEAPETRSERRMMVRFDANVASGMPWVFEAPKPVELVLGESGLVAYKARNTTDRPILGTAIYNVVPQQTGSYFNKVECFCFTEQLLMPGEEKEFPVTFFVDPAIEEDPNLDRVTTITLSYTFFDKGPEALKEYMSRHEVRAAELTGAGE